MKWQRRRSDKQRNRNTRTTCRFSPRLEWLEERQVLAANVLADVAGTVNAGTSNELALTVEIPDGAADAVANVAVLATAADGSTLDPAAVSIRDAVGSDVVAISMNDNAHGTTAGLTVAGLAAGDYTLVVSDEGATSGQFQIQVTLLGDTLSDAGTVTPSEVSQATAAVSQAMGGNFVTELFFQSLGIDYGVSQFDSGMDADGDGSLNGNEFALIQSNAEIGVVNILMQSDNGAPEVTAALQTDTGASNTDGISTDPTVTGSITDDGTITAFTASINGGAEFDLTTLFDPNAASTFTLSRDDLDQIAGGTLPTGEIELVFTTTDELGNSRTSDALEFVFVDGNTPPTSSGIADQTATEDQAFSLDVTSSFSDADAGDVLTFSVGTLPAWLSFDAATNTLSGTPENADVGSASITVMVEDSQGSAVSDSFTLNVANTNDAPTLSLTDRTVSQGSPVLIDLNSSASDVDAGDTVTLSIDGVPSWLQNNNGVLSGSPANSDVGATTLTVTATDNANATAQDTFVLTVVDANDGPTLVNPIDDQTVNEDEAFSLTLGTFFTDPDGDTLTLSVTQASGGALPGWLSFNATTNVLSGTPGSGDIGRVSIQVTATDPSNATATDEFLIDVGNVNDAPTATQITDATAVEGQAFSKDIAGNFSDPDPGDSLTLTVALTSGGALPAWLSFNALNGLFTGTPGNLDVGTLNITVTATDVAQLSASSSFDLTVSDVNAAPTIVSPINDQSVNQAESFSLDVGGTFDDEDIGDVLTLSANNLPGWLSFNPSNSRFTGTPANGDVGTVTIEVVATDLSNASVTDSFDITVIGNQSPTATDDTGFTTPDSDRLDIAVADLLANDTDPENDTLQISNINSTSQLGASVTLIGDTIQYDPSSSSQLIALHNGGELTDTFQYTVSDGISTDIAEVTVTVSGTDVVAFTLSTTNADGDVLTEIPTGQNFFLRGFVQDVRDDPTGVFSSYLDVEYPVAGATPVGSIVHASTYGAAASGSTATPGLIDEVGGVDGTSPLGGTLFEVFSLEFTAGAVPSTLTFTSNTTEDQVQHPVLLFGASANLDPAQILYGTTSINVTGAAAALADDGSDRDPLDVNEDGQISPLDALLIANHISGSGGANSYMDVNGDGAVSPLDMLMVVNSLGRQNASAAPAAAALVAEMNDEAFALLDEGDMRGSDSSVALLSLSNEDLFDRGQGGESALADGDGIRLDIELL